jgi:hypothetical protein
MAETILMKSLKRVPMLTSVSINMKKETSCSNQMDQDDGKAAKEFDSSINNQDRKILSFKSCCVYRNRMETIVLRIVMGLVF